MSTSSCSENNELRDCETFSGTLPPQNPSKTSTHSHFCTICSTCSSECPTKKNSFWTYFHTSFLICGMKMYTSSSQAPNHTSLSGCQQNSRAESVVTKWLQVAITIQRQTLFIFQNHHNRLCDYLLVVGVSFFQFVPKLWKRKRSWSQVKLSKVFWCSSLDTMVLVTNLSWSIQLSRKLQHHKIQWHVKTAFCHFFLQFHGLESKGIHRNW